MPRPFPDAASPAASAAFGVWGRQTGGQTFRWTARQAQGRLIHGQMPAGGVFEVRAQLRRQGLTPVSVQPAPRRPRQPVRAQDVVLFTRQLATLLSAGIPLLQGLQITREGQSRTGMAELIAQLSADLEAGLSFSTAVRRHPRVFPALYAHLVEAGEASGQLDVLLLRLASDLEKAQALRSKVRSALIYPAVVLSVALAVLAVVMAVVVPSFEEVFASFGAELPLATQLVMAGSRAWVAHGAWLTLVIVGSCAVLLGQWRRSEALRRRVERAVLSLPVCGDLLHQAAVARWSRTLSGLLAAGLPLVDAMAAARGAGGYYVYADACARLRDELSRGSQLHAAMGLTGLFSPMVQQMCAVGEESGALDLMLAKVAESHEREVDAQVAGLTSVLEPLIILVLGVLIGGLVIALYLPIFQMGQIT